MSRIGRKPLEIPKGVTGVDHQGHRLGQGPQGHAVRSSATRTSRSSRPRTRTARTSSCSSARANDGPERAAHGLMRALVGNMLTGVTNGLHAPARDQRRRLQGRDQGLRSIMLSLGYSHPIEYTLPDGITAKIDKNILILVGHRQAGARRRGRRRSAASVRPSRTRARASSTSKRRSAQGRQDGR